MANIIVSGLINIETTLKIEKFPLDYYPVTFPFFGINTTVSGVAVNIAKALKRLGDEADIISMTGDDLEAEMVGNVVKKEGFKTEYILKILKNTPQSVIVYENSGRRQIHCDLKDIQEKEYPEDILEKEIEKCDIAVLCTINFSRKFLKKAKEKGKIVASDLHVIGNIDDEYHRDFMKYANILFMSDENIREQPEDFIRKIAERYNNEIIAVGLGEKGALLYVKKDNFMGRFPAVKTREIVNTIGAGDALFSAFIHYYAKDKNPYEAMKRAILFASYKIGEKGAAEGFINEKGVEKLYEEVYTL